MSLTRWFEALYSAAKAEVQGMPRRPLEWFTGIVMPIFWCVLVGIMFKTGLMTDLPVAVVDNDHSPQAQRAIDAIDALPSISLVHYPNTLSADRALRTAKVYGTIVIDRGYAASLLDPGALPTPIVISLNKSYYATGTILEVDIKQALASLKLQSGVRLKTVLSGGSLAANSEHLRLATPDVYFNGNPAFNFNRYLLATLIPGLLVLAAALTFAGVLVRDWRDGTVRAWLASAEPYPTAAILGKLLPWLTIYIAFSLLWVALFAGPLGWAPAGSLMLWFVASALLITATAAIVLFLSSLSLTWVLAVTSAVALFAPTFPFTAFSYPFEAMTPGVRVFGEWLPLTHYLQIQGDIMVLNSPLDHVFGGLGKLALFTVVPLIAGLPILAWRTHKWKALEEKSAHLWAADQAVKSEKEVSHA